MRSFSNPFLRSLLAVVIFGATAITAQAQDMDHHARTTAPSAQLTVKGLTGESITLTPEQFAALPHKAISVFNGHSKTNEKYSGVPLTELLGKVGVPQGEEVKGKLFLTGIIAEGTDGYGVLYTIGEVDPSIHAGDVLVADSVDDHKLDRDGAFKLISSEEKRPARWVRNLSSITVVEVKP